MNHSLFNKIIVFFIIFSIAFTCFSCALPTQQDATTSVVATNFPAYDFAKQVCGDSAQVTMLLPAGGENHSYEPTAQDIIKINNCDLFIYSGGESDAWVDKILSSLDEKIKTLKMTDCVSLIPVSEHENEFDEHVWTSPANAVLIVEKIKDNLSVIDKSNKTAYEENAANYIKQITELDNDFSAFFNTVEKKTMIFGDRFPFVYFTQQYGISYASAFPGCADHSEPSATQIADLIKKIDSEKISTVYYIEFSNQNIAKTLADATGAKTALFHSCHNVSKEQLDNGVTYVSLMRENLNTLKNTMQ